MEVFGESVHDLKKSDETLLRLRAPTITRQMLSALKFVHFKCVIRHGDVSAKNVLYNKNENTAKICDFGLALKHAAVGTPDFTSTDVDGGQVSTKTDDLISLG